MSGWDSYERQWAIHANQAKFRAKVERAKQTAREGASKGNLFCSLSGGKDSVAMAGLLGEAGVDVPAVYAHTILNMPEMLETVEATADRLNLELHVIGPDPDELEKGVKAVSQKYRSTPPQPSVRGYDEWTLLQSVPPHVNILDAYEDIGIYLAAGNLLVGHTYASESAGSFVGLRKGEGKNRLMYRLKYGPIHQSAKDDTWQVCPIIDWDGDDVFAFIQSRDLPLHPFYRKAWELGSRLESPARLRVDMAIVPEVVARHGALATIARIYPAFWRDLVRCRPELGQYR